MENPLLFEFLAALGGLTIGALVGFNPHKFASKVVLTLAVLLPFALGYLKLLVVVSGSPDVAAVEAVTGPLVSQLLGALPSLLTSEFVGAAAGLVFGAVLAPLLRSIRL